MKCLITMGATREFLDPVRFISNVSTGKTGSVLAGVLASHGWDVTCLAGGNSMASEDCAKVFRFEGHQSLDLMLRDQLRREHFDAIIHAAAVSDFSPAEFETSKIDSESDEIVLRLKKNHKIIDRLRIYSQNRDIKIVGFKYTHTSDGDKRFLAINKLLDRKVCDYLVHNDGHLRSNSGKHEFWTYNSSGLIEKSDSPRELGFLLASLLKSGKEITS